MRIWHVSLMLAAVVVLSVAQLSWAQTSVPAGVAAVDDAQEQGPAAVSQPGQDAAAGGATTQQTTPKPPFDTKIILVMVGVMVLLWWWMGRGRKKEQKKHLEMLSALKKGDKVTSIGGIIGTVVEVKEKEVVVKVDESSNARMKFLRSAIRNVGGDTREDSPAGDSKK